MQMLSITVTLLIGGAFILGAVAAPFAKRYRTRGMRFAAAFASILLIVGTVGFLGASLSAAGGLSWLPQSFEWPIGYASGVVSMPDGTYVVPHTPSSRVQVYDPAWRFVRGWYVDTGGGRFKLVPVDNDRVEVITERGSRRNVYTLGGSLVARGNYSPGSYSSFPDNGKGRVIRTLPWHWLFSSPFISLAVAALGMGVLTLLNRKAKGWVPQNQPQ